MRQILSIPLASHNLVDRWKWYPKESGEYIVCSGYRLLLKGFPTTEGDRYNNIGQDTRTIYRKLWEANVPER